MTLDKTIPRLLQLVTVQFCLMTCIATRAQDPDAGLVAILEDMQDSEIPLETALDRLRTASGLQIETFKPIDDNEFNRLCTEFQSLVSKNRIVENSDKTQSSVETLFSVDASGVYLVVARLREFREVPRIVDGVERWYLATSSMSFGRIQDLHPRMMLLPRENGICRVAVGVDESSGATIRSLYTERHTDSTLDSNKISNSSSVMLFYAVLDSQTQIEIVRLWRDLVQSATEVTTRVD